MMTNLTDHLQSEIKYCADRAIQAMSERTRNYWIGKQHGYENILELLIKNEDNK